MSLIDDIKTNEGFKGRPYKDSRGIPTIGYGTKLPLSKEEGELLALYRLNKVVERVNKNLVHLDIEMEAWEILYEMAYQMGVKGLLKFKKMIRALKYQDYQTAAKEGRDSLWNKQTPNRSNKLMDKLEIL